MKSPSVELQGVQVPRVRHAPQVRQSAWEDVADLAAAYGLTLDPWQENVLQAGMGERSDGRWAANRVGVSVPRQNGKGAIIEARELAGLLLFGEQVLIHSAHEQKTARIGFERLLSYFENFDDLRRRVKQVIRALNRESIELKTGQKLSFLARSKGSGRGFSADLLVLDEAQILADATWAAVLPAISARPNPQAWLFGTPPTPLDDGEVFTRFRQAGLEGKDTRLAWCEWSAPDDCDRGSMQAASEGNPALGIRIMAETVEDERSSMDVETYARERLGMWDASAGASLVIDRESWDRRADENSRAESRKVVAVDVNPERSRASVGLAGLRADGSGHVELWEQRNGTGWVVPFLTDLWALNADLLAVVVDEASPAATLIPDLRAAGLTVVTMVTRDVQQACGAFYDGVANGRLWHTGQPQLWASLAGAAKRMLGDRWAWNRKTTASDITPTVAVTYAYWGVLAEDKVRARRRRSTSERRAVVL